MSVHTNAAVTEDSFTLSDWLWSWSLSSKSCHHSVPTKKKISTFIATWCERVAPQWGWQRDYLPILLTAGRSATFLFDPFCFISENFHSHHPACGCREIEWRREQRANVTSIDTINSQQLAGASQRVCLLFSGLQLHESQTPLHTSPFLLRHEKQTIFFLMTWRKQF